MFLTALFVPQEHMKLGNRTQSSLDVLLKSSSITKIMQAVSVLEVSTRWSEACAQCIGELGAIERIYGVIQSCNRSKPEQELARMCLQTLANFTQYKEQFRRDLAELPLAADVLASFITQMRDADEAGVLQAASLLRYICGDVVVARKVACMQSVGGQPTPEQRLKLTVAAYKRRGKRSASVVKSMEEIQTILKRLSGVGSIQLSGQKEYVVC